MQHPLTEGAAMNLSKLREQIADLKAERDRIDHAIQALESLLSGLNTDQVIPERPRPHIEPRISRGKRRQDQSYRALGIKILREAGKPVHITDVTSLVSEFRGKPVKRAAVESSLIRAMKNPVYRGKLRRDSPGMFVFQADS